MVDNIKLRIIGPLREELGLEEEIYSGETLGNIVDQFVENHRTKLEKYLAPKKGSLKYIMIILNKTHYLMLKDRLDTELEPGDQITLTLPVGGG